MDGSIMQTENYIIGRNSSEPVKDFDAIIADLKKPVKNLAPRGKKIIHPLQARYLHRDEISLESVESTYNEGTLEETKASAPRTPSSGTTRSNGNLRAKMLELLHERQEQYHKQEMALGGYHDVFNDPCPKFEPHHFSSSQSSMSSEEDTQSDIKNCDANGPRPSQGRAGEGWSTPQANHTFGLLRHINISAVQSSDSAASQADENKNVVSVSQQNETDERSAARILSEVRRDPCEEVLSRMVGSPRPVRSSLKIATTTVLDGKSRTQLDCESKRNATSTESSATAVCSQVFNEAGVRGSADDTNDVPNNETFVITTGTAEPRNDNFCSKPTSSVEPIFAVPVIPPRLARKTTKTTLEQRETRINAQHKNTSIVDLMELDVPSPGRTHFAARPLKKLRPLTKTPVKANTPDVDAEVSISMSDMSQQPSSGSKESSYVDPASLPEPSLKTPTRSTEFSRGSHIDPAVSTNSAASPVSITPSLPTALVTKSKLQQKKETMERLSRPRSNSNASCPREQKRQELKRILLSPNVNTMRGSHLPQPVTPFQPVDASRMLVVNPERSGTAPRMPAIRSRHALMLRTNLPSENSTPTTVAGRNVLKRREYKSIRKSQHASSTMSENNTGIENIPVNETSPDHVSPDVNIDSVPQAVSSHCRRAPAGNNAVSLSSVDPELDALDRTLVDAAKRLSLDDNTPDGLNHVDTPHAAPNSEMEEDIFSQKLLPDSLCTTDTPHRAAHELQLCRREVNTHDSGTTANTCIDVSGNSCIDNPTFCTEEPADVHLFAKKKPVMILKPRKVVHPNPPQDASVRRSTRNRMLPVRQWLGEKPLYTVSPGGSRTLKGVNEVKVTDPRWLKVRTANLVLAVERERSLAAQRRLLREKRKQEARERKLCRIQDLRARHRSGKDLNITEDSIVTSSDEDSL